MAIKRLRRSGTPTHAGFVLAQHPSIEIASCSTDAPQRIPVPEVRLLGDKASGSSRRGDKGSRCTVRVSSGPSSVAHGNAIRPKKFAARPSDDNGPLINEIAPLLFRACLLERLREIGVVKRIPQIGTLTDNQFVASVGESLDASHFDEALARISHRVSRHGGLSCGFVFWW